MGIEGFRQRSEKGCLGGGGVAVVQTERYGGIIFCVKYNMDNAPRACCSGIYSLHSISTTIKQRFTC